MSAGIRTAVILAAGRGTRFGERGTHTPKGFLQLGERPIVEESIERLLAAGIERVVCVTGHLRERYDALASARREVETLHNPRYASSGSMLSLWCARERLEEDFLLLESDLVYESRALDALLGTEAPDALLLSGFTGAGDEIFVETDAAGYLVDMSKDRTRLGPHQAGELVGITRVSLALLQVMLEEAERAFSTTLDVEYETDTLVAAARRHRVFCPIVEDLAWAEIDDERALSRTRAEVYGRIPAL